MPIHSDEANACVKVLVALAKADGRVHADELRSLTAAFSGLDVDVASLRSLLDENIDVAAEVVKITSAEGREQTYRSAYFLAYADGECSASERAILEVIAAATVPSDEQRASLDRIFATMTKRTRDRRRLERMCRYLARPPIATERLTEVGDDLRYELKKVWRDGTRSVTLDPDEWIARICAMVPPPRFHPAPVSWGLGAEFRVTRRGGRVCEAVRPAE
jgi:tellurite resistance protein